MRTICGSFSLIISTASSPVPTVPISSRSSVSPNRISRPWRTTWWSSTARQRVFVAMSRSYNGMRPVREEKVRPIRLKMPRMYGSIVVGTDGSDTAKEAVRQAGELAKALGGSVLLVSAYEPVPEARLRHERTDVPMDVSWMVNPREDVQAVLDEEAESIKSNGVVDVRTYAREGDPADAILDVAEEEKADLIVVG